MIPNLPPIVALYVYIGVVFFCMRFVFVYTHTYSEFRVIKVHFKTVLAGNFVL